MKRFIVAACVALMVVVPAAASAQTPTCCEDGTAPATIVNQDPNFVVLPVTLQIYSESPTAQFELETFENVPIRSLDIQSTEKSGIGTQYTVTVDSVPRKAAGYHICVASAPGSEYICQHGYEVGFYVPDPVIAPSMPYFHTGRTVKVHVSLQVASVRPVMFHSVLQLQRRIGKSWFTLQRFTSATSGRRLASGAWQMPTVKRSFRLPKSAGRYRIAYHVQVVTDLEIVQGSGSNIRILA